MILRRLKILKESWRMMVDRDFGIVLLLAACCFVVVVCYLIGQGVV